VGTGTLTLTGNNNYAGITNVSGGVLNFTTNATLGITSVSAGATLGLSNSVVNVASLSLNNGTLASTGISSLNGNINLGGNSVISTALSSDTLTLNGAINGANALALQGPGAVTLANGVGNVTRLSSFTTSSTGTTTTSGGSVMTTGNQTYNNPFILLAATILDSSAGTVTMNQSVNGANNLTVNSAGATTFNGAVGGVAALMNLVVNSVSTALNGGAVTTSGNQTYNEAVSLGANATLNTGSNISFMNGVSGNNNLVLNGTAGNNNFMLTGNLALNNMTVTGSGSGNNVLTVQTNNPQQAWNITSANNGNISGIAEMSGAFNFGNIQNLVGGNKANVFTLRGGSIAGSITGGSGVNTLAADNVSNVWSITGVNSGSVTGVNSFNQIQNITGGASNNIFNFANNSGVTGVLNGGGSATNTLNYAAYAPVVLTLTSDHGGTVQNISGGFVNVNNLAGNGADTLRIANSSKTNFIHLTGALQGYVNDPTTFSGFNSFASGSGVNTQVVFDTNANYNVTNNTAVIGGASMSFSNIQNYSGNITAQVNASQNAAITSAVNVSVPTTTTSNSNNSATTAVSSASESALQSSIQISNTVTNNMNTISDAQSNDDLTVTNSQKVETNCS
jgi:hypothetical protein